ncbi:MAG TPA: hypothetical protein VHD87_12640 [Acidimicrobiales bacterium]|nr:hypothetical protein [Acidimicrobiales bacterium]
MPDDRATQGWLVLHVLLDRAGMPRPTQPVVLDTGEFLSLGWPELRIALAVPGEDSRAFRDDGWSVFDVPAETLIGAAAVFQLSEKVRFERDVVVSKQPTVRKTSNTEDVVLRALLAAGVPMPERAYNFRVNGKTVTTPDFAWVEAKVAVFVDGVFWHGGSDLRDAVLQAGAENPERAKQLAKHHTSATTDDKSKRRKLTLAGWRFLEATDEEVADPARLAAFVAQVVELLAASGAEPAVADADSAAARDVPPRPVVDDDASEAVGEDVDEDDEGGYETLVDDGVDDFADEIDPPAPDEAQTVSDMVHDRMQIALAARRRVRVEEFRGFSE